MAKGTLQSSFVFPLLRLASRSPNRPSCLDRMRLDEFCAARVVGSDDSALISVCLTRQFGTHETGLETGLKTG